MLVDTHCHLAAREFDPDREAVLTAARAVGVSKIVIPAVDMTDFVNVRDCCKKYAECFPAYGIHPLYVAQANDGDLATLREWLLARTTRAPVAVAVGEIGLDLHMANTDLKRQEYFFTEQLKIARNANLPVLLHIRRAGDLILKHLRRIHVRGGIAHAFNGSDQQAKEFVNLGFKLGFGGAMTYTGSTRIRRLATSLPIENIVLETDAPDMPPEWSTGTRNEPATLATINNMLSELRGIDADELSERTSANAMTALPQLRSPG